MCGRFYVSEAELDDFSALVEGIEKDLLKPRSNQDGTADFVPGDAAPVLVSGGLQEKTSPSGSDLLLRHWQAHAPLCGVRIFSWGFPGPAGKGRVINARAETVMEKPMFRLPFQGHRCIIPASGFYEWTDMAVHITGNKEQMQEEPAVPRQMTLDGFAPDPGPRHGRTPRIRYRFVPADGKPLALAGLYWSFPLEGTRKLTAFTVLTVEANADVSPVHNRMPLLIPMEQMEVWLRPGVSDPVRNLLVPTPAGGLRCEAAPAEPA